MIINFFVLRECIKSEHLFKERQKVITPKQAIGNIILFIEMLDHLEKSYFNRVAKDKYSFGKAGRFPKISKKYIKSNNEVKQLILKNIIEEILNFIVSFMKEEIGVYKQKRETYLLDFGEMQLALTFQINKHNSQGQCEKLKETYVPKWQVTKPKHPSCVIIDKHENLDSFLQLAEKQKSPDPFKYYPRDRIYSRHKSQVGIKFGTARRFNYDIQPQAKKLGPGYYYRKPQESKIKNGAFNHTKRTTFVDVEIDHSISPGPKYYIY